MGTLRIEVDDKILTEAEEILNAIGMDVQIAVSIFLRRVAMEKGLPISMTVAIPSQSNHSNILGDDLPIIKKMYSERTNLTITTKMIDELWKAFIKYHNGSGEIKELSYEISENVGMNQGSAFIYLNILRNLVKGKPNTRTLKMKDLTYLMEKIKSDLGENVFLEAIKSLELSVPYWKRTLNGNFADNVINYCESNKNA